MTTTLQFNINLQTQALIDVGKEVGLEVNTEKAKYKFMSCHQNARQNHDTKTANWSLVNVAKFRYLGMTVINQNLIHEKIKLK
jgi:hypothetical protein